MALRVDMTGNATGVTQMFNTVRTQAKGFASSITNEVGSSWAGIGKSFTAGIAGALAVGGIKNAIQGFIAGGKEIKEVAEQVDMSTDSWQRWANAVDNAGLSTEGFMRVVEALRSKMTQGLTDPKARSDMNKIGITDKDFAAYNSGKLSIDQLLQRALANAKGSNQQRQNLTDIIGARGLKFEDAATHVNDPINNPLYDPDAIKAAADADRYEKQLGKYKNEGIVHAGQIFSSQDMEGAYVTQIMDWIGSLFGKKPKSSAAAAPSSPKDFWAAFSVDPMDARLEAQRQEQLQTDKQRQRRSQDQTNDLDEQVESRSFRMADSQRDLMTIGDRRAAISGEIPRLNAEISARNSAAPTIFSKDENEIQTRTGKAKSEDFLTDTQRNSLKGATGKSRDFQINELREVFKQQTDSLVQALNERKDKYQGRTDDLQERVEKLSGSLMEKPLSFKADSMAKAGLYSASALRFNPIDTHTFLEYHRWRELSAACNAIQPV